MTDDRHRFLPHGVTRRGRGVGYRCRPLVAAAIVVGLGAGLAGCSASVTRHGHLLSPEDLQQIQPGVSQEQVKLTLGTPDTTSTAGGGGSYYYISSTRETVAFYKPKLIDRRIVAIYFDQFGTVDKVANYGLKDGKIFDYISRETPSKGREAGFLQQFFRGIGTFAGAPIGNPNLPGQ